MQFFRHHRIFPCKNASPSLRAAVAAYRILKRLFQIWMLYHLHCFLGREPSDFQTFLRYAFRSADVRTAENQIHRCGQCHAFQRAVSVFHFQILIDPRNGLRLGNDPAFLLDLTAQTVQNRLALLHKAAGKLSASSFRPDQQYFPVPIHDPGCRYKMRRKLLCLKPSVHVSSIRQSFFIIQ